MTLKEAISIVKSKLHNEEVRKNDDLIKKAIQQACKIVPTNFYEVFPGVIKHTSTAVTNVGSKTTANGKTIFIKKLTKPTDFVRPLWGYMYGTESVVYPVIFVAHDDLPKVLWKLPADAVYGVVTEDELYFYMVNSLTTIEYAYVSSVSVPSTWSENMPFDDIFCIPILAYARYLLEKGDFASEARQRYEEAIRDILLPVHVSIGQDIFTGDKKTEPR